MARNKYIWIILLVFLTNICTAQFPGLDLLRGKKKIEVPFEYVQGFIIVEVNFNRFLPLKFIFDTGAENTLVLKKEITDILGLYYSKQVRLLGSDLSNSVFAYISRNVTLQFLNSGPFKQDILILEDDLNNLDEITGMSIDGIIGANVFKNLVLEINYRKNKLIFHHPAFFEPPGEEFNSFKLNIKRNKPYLNCTTGLRQNSKIDVNLLLDTGASLNYLLHENSHEDIELPQYVIPGNIGTGIAGNLKGYMGKVSFLEFGDIRFERLTTSFQNLDESILDNQQYIRNGILGNKILSRFYVIIDYPRQKLYLKPRKWVFDRPFQYDKSGLIIFAIGVKFDKYYIKEVIPHTPADKADLRAGDYIIKFNGFNTRFITLETITDTLSRKAGKRIRMTIIRNGEKIKKEFHLEDFLEKNVERVVI